VWRFAKTRSLSLNRPVPPQIKQGDEAGTGTLRQVGCKVGMEMPVPWHTGQRWSAGIIARSTMAPIA
jgi:hypothetical protein